MKTEYGNIPKAACTQPTTQTVKPLNLNLSHEMPAAAHAPKSGAHSTDVYNNEIETWHFTDAQVTYNHAASTIVRCKTSMRSRTDIFETPPKTNHPFFVISRK